MLPYPASTSHAISQVWRDGHFAVCATVACQIAGVSGGNHWLLEWISLWGGL